MIRLQRTARISRGKVEAASQFAKEVAEYLKSKYPQVLAIGAYTELFGYVNTIHWFSDYESLSTLGNVHTQLASDKGYQDRLRKSAEEGLLIEGSIHDTLVQSL